MNVDKSPTWTLSSIFSSLFQPSSVNVFNAESGFLYRCLCYHRTLQSKYVSRTIVALFILFQSLPSSYFAYFSSLLVLHFLLLFLPPCPSYLSYFSILHPTSTTFPSSFSSFLHTCNFLPLSSPFFCSKDPRILLITIYIMTICIKDIIYSAAQVCLLGQPPPRV